MTIISASSQDQVIITKKKEKSCRIVDFPVPVDHSVNIKESEKREKYLDLAREYPPKNYGT